MNKATQVQDIEIRISMFLDQELSAQEEHCLLQLIKSNPEYHQLYQEAKALKELVRQHAPHQPAPPALHQSIRQQLQNLLPSITA